MIIRAELDFDGEAVKVFECRVLDAASGALLQRGALNIYVLDQAPCRRRGGHEP